MDVVQQMRSAGETYQALKAELDDAHEERKRLCVQAYQEGWSRKVIMEELHITDTMLSRYLKEAGVEQTRYA